MFLAHHMNKGKESRFLLFIICLVLLSAITNNQLAVKAIDDLTEQAFTYSAYSTDTTTTVYVPNIKDTAGWNTSLFIRNNHTSSAQITITYYTASGATYGAPQNYTVEANGRVAVDPPSNFSGSAIVGGNKDIGVVILVEHTAAPYSSATYEGIEFPNVKSIIPLVHRNNSGWNNEIFLQNTTANSTNVTVGFVAQTGNNCTQNYALAPRQTLRLDTSTSGFSCLGATFIGAAEVTSNLPVGVVYNQFSTNYASMIQASNAPFLGTKQYAPLVQNSNAGYLAGFVSENLTSSGNLYVPFYNPSGGVCANLTYTNPSWPVVAVPVPPPNNNCPTVISARFDGDDGKLMYTQVNQLQGVQASGYAAISHPTRTAVAPQVYHNWNGWVTGLQVQNAGNAGANFTVTFFNSNGAQQGQTSQWIAANAAITIFPSGGAFSGSAKVTGSQPVALVVNFLKSGSGDVLSSYTGINRPDGETVHSQRPGFDACTAPNLTSMQFWMSNSPHRSIGIYIGGVLRACSQPNLTSSWVTSTANQGWNFIPIWVGPQAPCTNYSQRFDYNSSIAYNQGVNEATSAANAANTLGLSNTIIYYDMEYYEETPSCITAAQSFVSGWVNGLHNNGYIAGVYGSACNVDDYATASNVPDAIWGAHWIYNNYTPDASPYGMACLSNNNWNGNRLRQYAGGHNETWGGVTINVDDNVADGPLAESFLMQTGTMVEAMDLLTENEGWILADQKVFWSNDSGRTWVDITPPGLGSSQIEAVFFVDTTHGWIMSHTDEEFTLSSTTDGGNSWRHVPFTDLTADFYTLQSQVHLHFVDDQTGWVVIDLPTGSNFSQGLLFKTENGGQTWVQRSIPIGEPVYFVNKQTGWVAGGANGDQLYKTEDGGDSWKAIVIPVASDDNAIFRYGLPAFDNEKEGIIPVTFVGEGQNEIQIYTTGDGGLTWTSINTVVAVPSFVMDRRSSLATIAWLAADNLKTTQLPFIDVQQFDFATLQAGWVYTSNGSCATNSCLIESHLLFTSNGGQTWNEILLPVVD